MAYDPSNLDPATESGRINIVRFLVGDTEIAQELQDSEISFTLTLSKDNPYRAASLSAFSLGAKYSNLVDTELEGMLKENYSTLSEQYYRLSKNLKNKAASLDGGLQISFGYNKESKKIKIDRFENNVSENRLNQSY